MVVSTRRKNESLEEDAGSSEANAWVGGSFSPFFFSLVQHIQQQLMFKKKISTQHNVLGLSASHVSQGRFIRYADQMPMET